MAGRDPHTRQRVLETAAHLFADRGFRKVTIREISRRARANVAAVNYHFGDKAGLYHEVLDMAIAVMQRTNDAARSAATGGDVEARLRAYVRVYIEHLLSSHGKPWLHRLMTRELADPSPALERIVDRAVRPRVEYLSGIVREIVGPGPDDATVLECVFSVQAQTVMMALPNAIADRLRGRTAWTPAAIDRLADHIAEFSIAGIQRIGARANESRRTGRREPRTAAR